MGSGQGEGIDLTFRGEDDGSELSFAMSADPAMFAREPFERHRDELPDRRYIACDICSGRGGV